MGTDGVLKGFEKLKNPKDYFKGIGQVEFSLPTNILMFIRNDFKKFELHFPNSYHYHYRHVLIFNYGDSIRMIIDGVPRLLQSRCFTLLLPYQYHRYILEKLYRIRLTFITFEMTENLYLEALRNGSYQFGEKVEAYLQDALDLFNRNRSIELPFRIGTLLAHLIEEKSIAPLEKVHPTGSSQLVSDICRLTHHHKETTIGDLSDKLNFSESYLRKTFRKAMGIGLGKYIIEIRLTDAMKYLSTTDKSISEISELVGYGSLYSLSRAFKNRLGVSPSTYRKAHRLGDISA